MSDPLMQPNRRPLKPCDRPLKPSDDAGGLFAGLHPPSDISHPPSPPPPTPPPIIEPRRPKDGTDAYKFLSVLLARQRDGYEGTAIWEVAAILHRPDHTVSQRFSEMVRDGWIRRTELTNQRPLSDKTCHLYTPLVDLEGNPLPPAPEAKL